MNVTQDDQRDPLSEHPVPPDQHARELQRLVHVHGAALTEFVRRLVPPDLTRLIDPQDVPKDAYMHPSDFRNSRPRRRAPNFCG